MKDYLSYKGSIHKEDDYYWVRVLGMQHAAIGYDGVTLDELELKFRDCIDFYISICEEAGDETEVSN